MKHKGRVKVTSEDVRLLNGGHEVLYFHRDELTDPDTVIRMVEAIRTLYEDGPEAVERVLKRGAAIIPKVGKK